MKAECHHAPTNRIVVGKINGTAKCRALHAAHWLKGGFEFVVPRHTATGERNLWIDLVGAVDRQNGR